MPTPGRVGTGILKLNAKKKGKSSGKPAKGGMAWALYFKVNPYESTALRALVESAASCYQTRTGKLLHKDLVGVADLPKALWSSPVALIVVRNNDGSETKEGPPLVLYANRAGLEVLRVAQPDKNFDKVIDQRPIGLRLPSSMPESSSQFESSYTKKLLVRGDESPDVTVPSAARWLVQKAAMKDGMLAMETSGLAYAFSEWHEDDSSNDLGYVICRPGGVREVPEPPPLSPEELEAAVTAQAAHVRTLKEEEGLAKGDPKLDAAVKELLRLKSEWAAATES
jgi:hypothetical protein